ncbi:Rid family detoxifying hydrolase [Gaiella sp.]|uniref:Rid family detoxifying hydrolase n=1 Tax=Gaiella sp. TaxID=2663207 RepID=UPI003983D0AC
MMRNAVSSPGAPKAVGPYSQAVVSGDHVFLSGQTPIDPASGALIDGSLAEQTQRCFDNLAAVLEAAALGFGDVVKVNVYLTSMADFTEMNEVYARQFDEPFPARTTVAVAALPLGACVEIELVARRSA